MIPTTDSSRYPLELGDVFQKLFSDLPVGAFIIQNRKFRIFNNQFQNILGYSSDELLAMDCFKPVFPGDRNMFRESAVKCLKGNSLLPHEYRFVRKDGKIGWAMETLISGQYEGKRAAMGYFVDMTERKEIEREYRKSQERFSGLYNSSKDAIGFAQLNGKLIDVNDAFSKLTGYSKGELLTKKYQKLTPERYWQYEENIINKVMRTGEPAEYEKEYIRKDGSEVPILLTTFLLRGEDAQPIGIAAIIKDISERKKVEQALKESEHRYRELASSLPQIVFETDRLGIVTFCNKKAFESFGYTPGDIQRVHVSQMVIAKDRPRLKRRIEKVLHGEKLKPAEYTAKRKDGSTFPVLVYTTAIDRGTDLGLIGIAIDISEEKRLRENMQFYISEITRSQEEERSRIARELHDDAVQALAALSLNIGEIVDCANKDGNRLSIIRLLSQLRKGTNNVMADLRQYSHELRPHVLDHLGLVPALNLLAEENDKRTPIKMNLKVIGSVRRLPLPTEVTLFRIAQEALRNVVKHSKATKSDIVLEFEPEKVKLSVIDNGRGFILPGTMDDLAMTARLGIIGMRERARLLNGHFSLQSELGKGTRVTVELDVTVSKQDS